MFFVRYFSVSLASASKDKTCSVYSRWQACWVNLCLGLSVAHWRNQDLAYMTVTIMSMQRAATVKDYCLSIDE